MTLYETYGRSGLNLAAFDHTVRPQDDFYRFVNGGWLDNVAIPDDRGRYGTFDVLREEAARRVRAIIEDAAAANAPEGSLQQKIGDLYASFMDETTIEARGITPISDDLALATTVETVGDLARVLGLLKVRGHGGFFYHSIGIDAKNSMAYISSVGQSGLSLPNESYYREEQYREQRTAFCAHINRMFSLAGVADAAGHADRVLALETQIASHHWDVVQNREAELKYNKMDGAAWSALFPAFAVAHWAEASLTPLHALDEVVVHLDGVS